MIGIGFGTMNTSIAFCEGEKNKCDILLSETSSRTIPYATIFNKLVQHLHIPLRTVCLEIKQ
jgi:molecular chaperone DnaK (HSP70)